MQNACKFAAKIYNLNSNKLCYAFNFIYISSNKSRTSANNCISFYLELPLNNSFGLDNFFVKLK